jgi:hypothetical protein
MLFGVTFLVAILADSLSQTLTTVTAVIKRQILAAAKSAFPAEGLPLRSLQFPSLIGGSLRQHIKDIGRLTGRLTPIHHKFIHGDYIMRDLRDQVKLESILLNNLEIQIFTSKLFRKSEFDMT